MEGILIWESGWAVGTEGGGIEQSVRARAREKEIESERERERERKRPKTG
jgi:hypothetical protein